VQLGIDVLLDGVAVAEAPVLEGPQVAEDHQVVDDEIDVVAGQDTGGDTGSDRGAQRVGGGDL